MLLSKGELHPVSPVRQAPLSCVQVLVSPWHRTLDQVRVSAAFLTVTGHRFGTRPRDHVLGQQWHGDVIPSAVGHDIKLCRRAIHELYPLRARVADAGTRAGTDAQKRACAPCALEEQVNPAQ